MLGLWYLMKYNILYKPFWVLGWLLSNSYFKNIDYSVIILQSPAIHEKTFEAIVERKINSMFRSIGRVWQTKSIPVPHFQDSKNKRPLIDMDLIQYKNASTLIGKLAFLRRIFRRAWWFFLLLFFYALRLIYFNYIECSKLDFVHPILPIIFFPLSPVDVGDTCIFSRFLKL